MQTQQNLLRKAYAAFNDRHIDAVLAVMHPDVAWANGMEGGHVHGHEAVRDYWTRQWQLIDPQVELQGFQRDGHNCIIVDVHQVVRDLEGKLILDQRVQHIYTIENGLIQRMDIQEARTPDTFISATA
ncbi:MAG: nuclear transport factor 2 family protein [Phormidium tanganyikae FI6-MK23]|nr:nuclear transport factor 2 family protein [Phormidium tanganyikae FI6-MK23]